MPTKTSTVSPVSAPPTTPETEYDLAVTLDVEPRKPRLAWQGMDRRELAASVPTQVVEIVRPGRAMERAGELVGLSARAAAVEKVIPENRLIWTNDNMVALQTLLDEKDPKTKDYRYRGKVDLIYIDPPFMVNNDFLADNAIDITLDEDAGVAAKKEPSLVEILAYKDTWRQGLDSFLSMLRTRLVLLRGLLAPTGSIYVHLDWHAVHYVKVLMDEIFGYENFRNEIIWRRTNARSAAGMWPRVHDTLLFYAMSDGVVLAPAFVPGEPGEMPHTLITGLDGKKYQTFELTAPHLRFGETGKEWRGFQPAKMGRCWANPPSVMDEWDKQGLIHWPKKDGGWPRRRAAEPFRLEDRVVAVSAIWDDVDRINQAADERNGYPTQKPVALLHRVIEASCPPGGLVLDCFSGSGTTAEAAERLGRRWIGIDNGKYAVHLARKRLIQLHGQPKPPEKAAYDYLDCEKCKNIERKERPQKSRGMYDVRPFTVENMGVYQRAAEWQGFQQYRSAYRDEMIRVFGGEPIEQSMLLHGKKGSSWVHVGPLDSPVSVGQVWAIARDAQRTSMKSLTILSADFDTLSGSEKEDIKKKTGVTVTIRVIPSSAIDEVKRRLDLQRVNPNVPVESMAIPAFYAPLSIVLDAEASGRNAHVRLQRCEVDIDSFIASQRPMLKQVTDKMTAAAKKKVQAESDRWEKRDKELHAWLKKAKSWQSFIDFWAVDWNYGRVTGEDGKPIFVTEWQSFRIRGGEGDGELVFTAKFSYPAPGHYVVAARVTDVFGNDGIATVSVEVKR